MPIEFEPIEWRSSDKRFDIDLRMTGYNAYQRNSEGWLIASKLCLPTFASAAYIRYADALIVLLSEAK